MTMNALESALAYLCDRLKEASTWTVIAGALALAHIKVPDGAAHDVATYGMILAAVLAVLIRERGQPLSAVVGDLLTTMGQLAPAKGAQDAVKFAAVPTSPPAVNAVPAASPAPPAADPAPTVPPIAGSVLPVLLAVGLMLGLAACSAPSPQVQAAIGVACRVDAALQPVLVTLAPLAGQQVSAIATVDQQLAHPLVQAACAAVGGTPVAVTVAPAKPA